MLRDPVEMLYSLHGRRHYGGSEDLADFEDALAAEEDRKHGRRIPPRGAQRHGALFYRDVGRYHDAGRSATWTSSAATGSTSSSSRTSAPTRRRYRQTLEFLGVDPDFEPDFNVVNAVCRAPESGASSSCCSRRTSSARPGSFSRDGSGLTWADLGLDQHARREAPAAGPEGCGQPARSCCRHSAPGRAYRARPDRGLVLIRHRGSPGPRATCGSE